MRRAPGSWNSRPRIPGALPESLEYRLDQQATLQEQVRQIDRDITTLRNQRNRLVENLRGHRTADEDQATPRLSPDEQRLQEMRNQLDEALSIYSETNPG